MIPLSATKSPEIPMLIRLCTLEMYGEHGRLEMNVSILQSATSSYRRLLSLLDIDISPQSAREIQFAGFKNLINQISEVHCPCQSTPGVISLASRVAL